MSVRAPRGRARAPLAKYVVTYPAGAKIYGEGEIGTELYAIRSGEVEITKTVAGETCVLGVVPRGEFFGEVSLLEDALPPRGARLREGSPPRRIPRAAQPRGRRSPPRPSS